MAQATKSNPDVATRTAIDQVSSLAYEARALARIVVSHSEMKTNDALCGLKSALPNGAVTACMLG